MQTLQSILHKIRTIDVRTAALSQQLLTGSNRSGFKGRGMDFSDLREYLPGDEVRAIDWNTSARYGETYVKVFEEEREQTVFLVVDISGSTDIACFADSKRETTATVAATLALSALKMRDKTGALLFSDKIEKLIPPTGGRPQVLGIIKDILEFQPTSRMTNVALALKEISHLIKRKSSVFIISDFASSNFEHEMEICARHHTLNAIRITNPNDSFLPPLGLISIEDAETGATNVIDTSQIRYRTEIRKINKYRDERLIEVCRRANIGFVDITTTDDCVKKLMEYFAAIRKN